MLNQDFKEFIQSLNDNHVRYLVIGGYAEVEIDETKVVFIDLDNLKRSKRTAGRLQDLADLENLE